MDLRAKCHAISEVFGRGVFSETEFSELSRDVELMDCLMEMTQRVKRLSSRQRLNEKKLEDQDKTERIKYCQICKFLRYSSSEFSFSIPHKCEDVPLSTNFYYQMCLVLKIVTQFNEVSCWIKNSVFPFNCFLYFYYFVLTFCKKNHDHLIGTVCLETVFDFVCSDIMVLPMKSDHLYFEPAIDSHNEIFKKRCLRCKQQMIMPSCTGLCACSYDYIVIKDLEMEPAGLPFSMEVVERVFRQLLVCVLKFFSLVIFKFSELFGKDTLVRPPESYGLIPERSLMPAFLQKKHLCLISCY